jgi:hypothetical protein
MVCDCTRCGTLHVTEPTLCCWRCFSHSPVFSRHPAASQPQKRGKVSRQGSRWSSRTCTSRRRRHPARLTALQPHGQLLHRPPRLFMRTTEGQPRRRFDGVTAHYRSTTLAAGKGQILPTGDCETASTMVASIDRSPHSATKISVATWTKACQADLPLILPLASAESIESRAPSSSPPSAPSGVSHASCLCRMQFAGILSSSASPTIATPDKSPATGMLPSHLYCADAKVHQQRHAGPLANGQPALQKLWHVSKGLPNPYRYDGHH